MADEKSDDILSLEDLLREDPAGKPAGSVAGAPVPDKASGGTPAPTSSASATEPAPKNAGVDEVDKLLAIEDPEFSAQMKDLSELKADDVSIDADIDGELEQVRKEAAVKGYKKLVLLFVKRPMRRLAALITQLKGLLKWVKEFGVPGAINGAKSFFAALKSAIAFVLGKVRAGIAWFKALPRKSKAILVVAGILALVAIGVAQITLNRSLFPNMDVDYLTSFETVADAKYTFTKEEKWTDLNDPLLHPEHVVLIERIISNLRSTPQNANPMALIDLYLESANQDVAIELKNREGEARDVIGTTLLQMTYDELTTEAGKTKLKVFLRKNLNEVLSTGRVRRVYFKSIIVKP